MTVDRIDGEEVREVLASGFQVDVSMIILLDLQAKISVLNAGSAETCSGMFITPAKGGKI